MIDRVEVSIIEESQPRWLSFLNSEIDVLMSVPLEFAAQARARRQARAVARQAGRADGPRSPTPTGRSTTSTWRIRSSAATRRRRWRCAGRSAWPPTSTPRSCRSGAARRSRRNRRWRPAAGRYDPNYRSENSVYSPARAKALLDLYGYVDRDGDGWRELPDGKPLVLEYATQPDALSRQFDELWKKNMDAIGIRLRMRTAQVARAAQGGACRQADDLAARLFVVVARRAGRPADAVRPGGRRPEPVALQARRASTRSSASMQSLPDGPERLALMHEARDLITAYMPQKYNVAPHRHLAAHGRGGRPARADVLATSSGSTSTSTTATAIEWPRSESAPIARPP